MTARPAVFIAFCTWLLAWLALNGSLAGDVMLVGAVVAAILALSFRGGLSVFSEFRFTPRAFAASAAYLVFFLKELVKSNLSLARIVLSPDLPLKPGIVKVRTRLQSRMGRLMLANSITLTPGTLTVEMEGEWLYIHWVTADAFDIEGATQSIVSGFESYLEEMYG